MDNIKKNEDFEADLSHEDHSIEFLMWVTRNYPDAIIKYMDDDDGGEEAFKQLYKTFKSDNEAH